MLGEVPEKARKIADVITQNDKGTIVSPELIQSLTPDKKVSSNDMTAIRRAVLFVDDKPIVQEQVEGVRQRVYRSMDDEAYENYKFTERNFFGLEQKDIDKIEKRLAEIDLNLPKKDILRYLTICDMLVQTGGRGSYVKIKRRAMACSIGVPDDKLIDYLDFLAKAGIVSLLKGAVLYNNEFAEINSAALDADLDSEIVATTGMQAGFEAFFRQNDEMVNFMKKAERAIEESNRQIDNFCTENAKLKEQMNNLRSQAKNFPTLLTQYRRLQEENTQLNDRMKSNTLLAKSMREYQKIVLERKETVFAILTQKMMEATMQYQKDHKDAFFISRMNDLLADASKSMERALNYRK